MKEKRFRLCLVRVLYFLMTLVDLFKHILQLFSKRKLLKDEFRSINHIEIIVLFRQAANFRFHSQLCSDI